MFRVEGRRGAQGILGAMAFGLGRLCEGIQTVHVDILCGAQT